jgi:hypothetical protein
MRTLKRKTKADRMSRGPSYALKVKVEGPGVHRKSIAIPDLLKICTAIQTAVHRQAESMQRPTANTLRRGPITASAQQECTLELTAITGGSTGLTFRYSKPQQHLPLPGTPHFGTDVLAQVAETVKDFGGRKGWPASDVDAGVLDSLKDLSEVLETKRITKILLSVPKWNGKRQTIKAVVTPAIGSRIAARVKAPREERRSLEGRLEMADFKEAGRICRIHPVAGLPVQCSFDPDQEDRIYDALRRPARVTGPCKLNPNTGKIEELKIEEIEVLDELLLGAKDFFTSRTLEQLADAQGVSPLRSPADLAGGWPSDENVDEFIETTYRSRS